MFCITHFYPQVFQGVLVQALLCLLNYTAINITVSGNSFGHIQVYYVMKYTLIEANEQLIWFNFWCQL